MRCRSVLRAGDDGKARRLTRSFAALSAVLLLGLVATSGVALARDRPAASANSHWLARQLSAEGTYDNPLGGALPDHGLMIDALFAMHASGDAALAAPIVSYLDDQGHASDYFTWDGLVPDQGFDAIIVGGAAAKVLVAAEVSGRNPRNFDGYDMVVETERAIRRSGPDIGRVSDYSKKPEFNDIVSNNANMFGQALAVIGLAAAGSNDAMAIDKMVSQQCSEGFFRIFFEYIPTTETGDHVTSTGMKISTCDEGKEFGKSAPDRDTTGLALSAMLAARKAGYRGLDGPIDRAVTWLKGEQDENGGWGGGVSTEAPNTNSTGLVVQALAEAGGAEAEVTDGLAYLKASQATPADAETPLVDDIGAIAYNPEQYQQARTGGIAGTDTWIRAGAQASLGLSQVGFFALAEGRVPPGDPTPQPEPEPERTPRTAGPESDAPTVRQGNPAPPPGRGVRAVVTPEAPPPPPGTATPAGRLGAYLAGALVGGDHVEVTQDGSTFTDYDATADLVLALRTLGEQGEAVERATRFLLRPESIDAYAHGKPYEAGGAAYAEPLAKLTLIARFDQADDQAPLDLPVIVNRLAEDLAALRGDDGRFTDTGSLADTDHSARRQAWAIAATVAVPGTPQAEQAVDVLVGSRCDDGSFPVELDDRDCAAGDLTATATALAALNLRPRDRGKTEDSAPENWSPDRAAALVDGVKSLNSALDEDGLVLDGDGNTDVVKSAAAASGRQVVGLDASTTARSLGAVLEEVQGDAENGLALGVAAAPGVAARSWVDAEGSPVAAAVRLPLTQRTAATSVASEERAVPVWTVAVLSGIVLAVALGLLLHRSHTRKNNNNTLGVSP
ncbi:hypothetical protein AB0I60_02340 [Actinosynnema sp. NPDC050436]|uniref:hypothetical protein n=1 Tax=Actinosynnema sp. NPDC050436 TaxID=3155659 RepID=UPI0033E9ECF5